MRKKIGAVLLASAFALSVGAAPAFGDRGAPGSTFPEQPGANPATGCAAILANTGTGVANDSDTAFAIQVGLVNDACF